MFYRQPIPPHPRPRPALSRGRVIHTVLPQPSATGLPKPVRDLNQAAGTSTPEGRLRP